MTQFSNGIYEDAQGNMVDINGKVLVEVVRGQAVRGTQRRVDEVKR